MSCILEIKHGTYNPISFELIYTDSDGIEAAATELVGKYYKLTIKYEDDFAHNDDSAILIKSGSVTATILDIEILPEETENVTVGSYRADIAFFGLNGIKPENTETFIVLITNKVTETYELQN